MTKPQSGAAWQVSSQGANADKCTGNQLQLANVANQGNAYEKETYCCGHEIKLARMAKDSRVIWKNVGPSCSTWHQEATMYLPSTPYTGESMM